MKKRYIFLSLIILSAFALLFLLLSRNVAINNVVEENVIPEIPGIDKVIENDFPIENEFKKDDFNKIPSQLPLVQISSKDKVSADYINRIIQAFNLKSTPREVVDVYTGELIFWIENNEDITIRKDSNQIEYTSLESDRVPNINLTDDEIITVATKFMKDKFLINKNIKLQNILYLTSDDQEHIIIVNRARATFFQVNFTLEEIDYPLYTVSPLDSPFRVIVRQDGTIQKAYAPVVENFTVTNNKINLMTFEQFNDNLINATLATLDDDNFYRYDALNKIDNVIAEEVEIGYLYAYPERNVMQPTFLIKGSARVLPYGKMSAYFYLPAIEPN